MINNKKACRGHAARPPWYKLHDALVSNDSHKYSIKGKFDFGHEMLYLLMYFPASPVSKEVLFIGFSEMLCTWSLCIVLADWQQVVDQRWNTHN